MQITNRVVSLFPVAHLMIIFPAMQHGVHMSCLAELKFVPPFKQCSSNQMASEEAIRLGSNSLLLVCESVANYASGNLIG